jgi:hypothetical protein
MRTAATRTLDQVRTEITLLKGRERSLQQIAQSEHTANRPGAERELAEVRDAIRSSYASMRPFGEHS